VSVRRIDVISTLAACEPGELRLVLDACGISAHGADDPRALAERVTNALWWAWCTPLGYALDTVTLDHIVDGVARRLRIRPLAGDAWSRLDHLHHKLANRDGPVTFQDLNPEDRARAHGSPFPTLAWAGGSLGSLGTGAAARWVLHLAATPVGRWIPWIPQIGPWFVALRRASAVAAVVTTPLGVALAVLAVNQALGTRWRTVLPVLLSIGALHAHRRSAEAQEMRPETAGLP
jgi:hypothetical protein